MLEEVLSARGMLMATHPWEINSETENHVRRALNNQTLWWVTSGFVKGNRVIDTQSGIALSSDDLFPEGTETAEPAERAKRFVEAMKRVSESEGVAELKLAGTLVITVDADDDVYVARLTFKNSEIFFQEAGLHWLIETPI